MGSRFYGILSELQFVQGIYLIFSENCYIFYLLIKVIGYFDYCNLVLAEDSVILLLLHKQNVKLIPPAMFIMVREKSIIRSLDIYNRLRDFCP